MEEMPMPMNRNVLNTPPQLTLKQMREVTVAIAKSVPDTMSKFAAEWLIRHQGHIQDDLRFELEQRLADAEEVAWWQEFYAALFGLKKVDFQKIATVMPEPTDQTNWLVVVPPNLDLEAVVQVCREYFPLTLTAQATKHLSHAAGTRDKENPKGYIIRTDASAPRFISLMPDPDKVHESSGRFMSLKERLLLELALKLKGNESLLDSSPSFDTNESVATLCSGPGVPPDGRMVVYGDDGRVFVDHYQSRAERAPRARRVYGRWVSVGNLHVVI
jgi:hypothetical protein